MKKEYGDYLDSLAKELIEDIVNVVPARYLSYDLYVAKNDKYLRDKVIDGVFDKIFGKDSKVGGWAKFCTRTWLRWKYGI